MGPIAQECPNNERRCQFERQPCVSAGNGCIAPVWHESHRGTPPPPRRRPLRRINLIPPLFFSLLVSDQCSVLAKAVTGESPIRGLRPPGGLVFCRVLGSQLPSTAMCTEIISNALARPSGTRNTLILYGRRWIEELVVTINRGFSAWINIQCDIEPCFTVYVAVTGNLSFSRFNWQNHSIYSSFSFLLDLFKICIGRTWCLIPFSVWTGNRNLTRCDYSLKCCRAMWK